MGIDRYGVVYQLRGLLRDRHGVLYQDYPVYARESECETGVDTPTFSFSVVIICGHASITNSVHVQCHT